jgi:hypothetical protein
MSLERKLKRKKAIKAKKSAEKEMATKVALFGKIGDKCLTCAKPFDKMDKEQVKSWYVIAQEKEETVRLYCPPCWEKAIEIVQSFKEHLQRKSKK